MKLKIKATPLFVKIREAKTRIIVNEGGARSSKTYSTLQNFITEALESNEPKEFDIVRETFPALRATAMKDFFDIIRSLGLYDENNDDMSAHSYLLNGCPFNFYSVDEAQKIRGRKRWSVLMNEANEMSLETFRQLEMRTEGKLYLDYNPSEEEHWIYDHVIPRADCTFIHSTYLDNPFLPEAIKKTIENYKEDDPEYWKIYGLGQRGKRQGLIFTNWDIVPDLPVLTDDAEVLYGLDLGFNDPKVLVKLVRIESEIWIDELLYEHELVRSELIERLRTLVPLRSPDAIVSDNDPETIEDIYRAGFNIEPAEKGEGSVLFGIEELKGFTLHITQRSVNIQKDFRNYKWKTDKNGKVLDAPVHSFSHGCDTVRYPVHTKWAHHGRRMRLKDAQSVRMEQLESNNIEIEVMGSSSLRGY